VRIYEADLNHALKHYHELGAHLISRPGFLDAVKGVIARPTDVTDVAEPGRKLGFYAPAPAPYHHLQLRVIVHLRRRGPLFKTAHFLPAIPSSEAILWSRR
jgi:hypothetical protein